MNTYWAGQRMGIAVWFGLLAALLAEATYPVTYCTLRVFVVLASLALWLGAVVLMRRRKVVAVILLLLGLSVVIFVSLPGRAPAVAELRAAYVKCLQRYEGTRYVWGGENRRGIDCSGLVREALIDADVLTGLRTLNPQPIRAAFELWWFDCSAAALRDEYRTFTCRRFTAPSINSLTNRELAVGDLAVTVDGLHVLAFVGSNTWVEADPDAMKVINVACPSDNLWFHVPVQVMRWRQWGTDSPPAHPK